MTTLSGDYIKKARVKMGFTQEQLGKKMDRKQSEISNYERGLVMPPMEFGMKLMDLEKKFDRRLK